MSDLLFKLSIFVFLVLFSVNLKALEFEAESVNNDFKAVNLKAFYGYIDSDAPFLSDKNHYYYEVETIARKGKWDLYGFTDLQVNSGQVNYDFFKYIVKYEVLSNNKLFIVAEAKETFGDQKSDAFIGLGTSFAIPVIGNLNINAMYFMANEDNYGNKLELPFMLQFSWYNELGKIGNTGLTVYHGGWADVDFFEKRKDTEQNKYAIQAYEGIGINYETYATEIGYKYWNGIGGNNWSANSVFVYLIKRF